MYDGLMRDMGDVDGRDSVHAASWIAIEFQAAATLILMGMLAARLLHPLLAVPAIVVGAAVIWKLELTPFVLAENDQRFQTLLFYFMVVFGMLMAYAGWLMWK